MYRSSLSSSNTLTPLPLVRVGLSLTSCGIRYLPGVSLTHRARARSAIRLATMIRCSGSMRTLLRSRSASALTLVFFHVVRPLDTLR